MALARPGKRLRQEVLWTPPGPDGEACSHDSFDQPRRLNMVFFEDSTERRRAEKAPSDADEFQRRLFAGSQDCVNMLDLEGRLLWMNEGGTQALEICDFGQFANSSWIQLWEGDDINSARGAVEAARKG